MNDTLVLQFPMDWTEAEVESLVDTIADAIDSELSVIAVPDGIELLDREQFEQFANQLYEMVNDD